VRETQYPKRQIQQNVQSKRTLSMKLLLKLYFCLSTTVNNKLLFKICSENVKPFRVFLAFFLQPYDVKNHGTRLTANNAQI